MSSKTVHIPFSRHLNKKMLNIKNNSQELFNQNQILIIYGEKIEVVSNSYFLSLKLHATSFFKNYDIKLQIYKD